MASAARELGERRRGGDVDVGAARRLAQARQRVEREGQAAQPLTLRRARGAAGPPSSFAYSRHPAFVLALDHDARLRFRSAVADQHPAAPVERRLDAAHRFEHARQALDRPLLRDAHAHQHLRVALEAARQLREAAALAAHDRERLERREQAVAGGVVIEEDDVARLLAAEVVAAAAHRLDHVAVADLRAHEAARRSRRAPARGRGCSSPSPRPCRPAACRAATMSRAEQREQRVAVDHVALLVDQHGAVRVAVERDADVGAQLAHLRRRLLGKQRRRSRR